MTESNPPAGQPRPAAQRPDEDEIDLGYLFAVCLDNKWLILGCTALITLIGIAYAWLATPVYQADALLQVESQERNLGNLEDVMLGQDTVQSSTQSEILRSRMIMSRAAAQAQLDLVVRPETWPVVGDALLRRGVERPGIAAGSHSVWAGESINVEELTVGEALLNQPLTLRVEQGRQYRLLDEDGETLGTGMSGARLSRDTPYLELLVSEINAPAGAEFTLVKRSEQAMTRYLSGRFNVSERGRDTGILEVTLTGTDREEVRRSLDAITNVYLVQNINRQAAEAENRLAFLEEQAPELRDSLSSAEDALNSYRASRDSVDLSFETQSMLQRLVEIDARLNELELEENELSQRFTRSHPSYQTLLEQRAQLEQERQRLNARADNLPETQREVLRLTRDVEVTQEIYTQMLNTMQELRISRAGTVGNVRILDQAELAPGAISPRRSLIAVISLMLGLMLGLGVVLLRQMLRRGVESVDQIQATGLQVYATIPLSDKQTRLDRVLDSISRRRKRARDGAGDQRRGLRIGRFHLKLGLRKPAVAQAVPKRRRSKTPAVKEGVLAFADPGDLAVEALRSLRTSLHFAMLEARNNVLMLTGPSPGVGKSFVSANLAAVCAQAGQRVLLIDGDMRKGHLHEMFNDNSENGLSDLLGGRVDARTAVRQSEDENLQYIVRGMAPPNPSELLMSERFSRLLERASQQYDLIIIDTPPALAVTDAAVVGEQAGTTLMVLRFQHSASKEIHRANEQLANSGVVVRGAILNAVEKTATAYYGYGYGYYHYDYRTE
ncbi:MAG: polysaccharide biosynthesis tyrosine autokinase [Pseudomonadota bacterium]